MGFEGRVVRATMLDKLTDSIENRIHSGELADGDRMPAEGMLAVEYGVSRTVVREALAQLRARGYLETINGRGTFVRHPDADHLAEAFMQQTVLTGRSLTADDLYEARTAIETTAARLAAERVTPERLAELSAMLEDMVVTADQDLIGFTKADFGFHLAIARASGNPLLATLLGPLVRIIVAGVYESASTIPEAAKAGIRDHTRILRAIERGDGRAAARTIEAHLIASRSYYPHEVVSL